MIPRAASLLDRLKAYAVGTRDLTVLAKWVERNTQHPKQTTERWSFKDHEFQIAIASDSRQEVVTKKPSQVGISELSLRLTLAIMDVFSPAKVIYTLPTASYARKFTKSRFDPVVERSEYLKSQVPPGADSTELKQVGASFLHINGTTGTASPISIDADALIQDEVDFSDPNILSQYASRLGHAENGGIKRSFSTPTTEGYGISALIDNSSQARYHVRHDHCGKWVAPSFLKDVIIPGFDEDVKEFTKAELQNPNIDIDGAYLLCPSCRNPISPENMMDPEKRQWIHAYPDHVRGGYIVAPFDLYKYNAPPVTLRAVEHYNRRADWYNFKIGETFQDQDNSVVRKVIQDNTIEQWLEPKVAADTGLLFGMDVGKVCHLVVGKKIGPESVAVVHAETVRQTGDNAILERLQYLTTCFGFRRGVIDAGPDFTIAQSAIMHMNYGVAYANYYTRSIRKDLSNFKVDETEQILSTSRTGSLDEMVRKVNKGKVTFARMKEMETMTDHLCNIRRVAGKTDMSVSQWNKVGDDHYAHALNYLLLADELCDFLLYSSGIPVPPTISKVAMNAGKYVGRLNGR